VGSGEWGVGNGEQESYFLPPLPIPPSPLPLFPSVTVPEFGQC
jgi:hypothetical protein